MGRDLIEYDYISVNWDGFIPISGGRRNIVPQRTI
jgi:hypothetical protein